MATSTTTLFVGPAIRDVVAQFSELTGRMASGRAGAWATRKTAMSLPTRPTRRRSSRASSRTAQRGTTFRCQRVPFRLGLHAASASAATSSPGIATSFPSRVRLMRAFNARACTGRQPQAVPARRPSALRARSPRAARSSTTRRRGAVHRPVLGRRGCAYRLHQSRRDCAGGRKPDASRCSTTASMRAGTTTTNTRSGTRTALSHGFGSADPDRSFASAAGAADDARHGRSAGRTLPGRACFHRHACRSSGHPALRADMVGRQHDELAHAALESAHGPHDEPVRHVQYRSRHRRIRGPVPRPELLVRWVQNGVFSPRFIMNSWKTGGEVNSPWLHPRRRPFPSAMRSACATG